MFPSNACFAAKYWYNILSFFSTQKRALLAFNEGSIENVVEGKRGGDFCQPNTNIEGAGLLSINFRVRWLFFTQEGVILLVRK